MWVRCGFGGRVGEEVRTHFFPLRNPFLFVVISHSLLSHGGQAWTCPYILLSLEASALLRQYTRSSLSTGYEPGPVLYPKTTAKITSHRE